MCHFFVIIKYSKKLLKIFMLHHFKKFDFTAIPYVCVETSGLALSWTNITRHLFCIACWSSCTQELNCRSHLTVDRRIIFLKHNFYSLAHRQRYGCKWHLNICKVCWEKMRMHTDAIACRSHSHLQTDLS